MHQKLWFKRKSYGWGWVPVTWQGWIATAVYIAGVLLFAFGRGEDSNLLIFAVPTIMWTALLIYICYKKGEKPRWQWVRDRE